MVHAITNFISLIYDKIIGFTFFNYLFIQNSIRICLRNNIYG